MTKTWKSFIYKMLSNPSTFHHLPATQTVPYSNAWVKENDLTTCFNLITYDFVYEPCVVRVFSIHPHHSLSESCRRRNVVEINTPKSIPWVKLTMTFARSKTMKKWPVTRVIRWRIEEIAVPRQVVAGTVSGRSLDIIVPSERSRGNDWTLFYLKLWWLYQQIRSEASSTSYRQTYNLQ